MNSLRRAFITAIILLIPYAILFGVFKLVAHAEDMVVDEFVNYLFFIILPLGYILFVTEGNEIFHRVCRIAGFLVIVVSTLVYHLGIPSNPDAFYLTYLILPISWGIMALLYVQEYKHNYIEIDTWEIFVSVLILMAVLVATQYISFGTPTAEGIKRAVNIYLIVGGVALAVLGIVKLKERGFKREYGRTHRPGVQRAPNPLGFDSDRYYCYDCKHCDFIIDDHGITHHYCKLSNTEVSYGRKQCSDKFERRW